MNINKDCPFCDRHLGDIVHLFIQCPLLESFWSIIAGYYPIPTNGYNQIGLNIAGNTEVFITSYVTGLLKSFV